MALALYRKYRPRTFAEVIGQEHVTEPLSQALRSGRLHHAYLFSGPRGCGKTSSARILARSLNCEQGPTPEPCGVCISCKSLANDGGGSIDVLEIDAASHGGVDDARELREKAFFAPANSRFKIYVIDEAHMVSSAGFNALLKLVEEPPEYVKFIFATTEPDKVLGTIRSRTHHYPFRLIPPATLRPYLQQLTEAEGVSVEPAVFPLVVRAGGGSARDSLSVLDQLIAGAGPDGVSYARAVALLGVTDVALIDEMCDALAAGDGAAAYSTIDRVAEAGHDPRRFASDLLERLRDLIVLQQVPDAVAKGLIDGPTDQLEAMSAQATRLGPATLSRCADIVHNGLIEMRGTTAPRLLLELITARMLLPGAEDSTGSLLQRLERMERRLTLSGDTTPLEVRGELEPGPPPQAAPVAVPEAPVSGGGGLSAARAAAAAARRASGAGAATRPTAAPGAVPATPEAEEPDWNRVAAGAEPVSPPAVPAEPSAAGGQVAEPEFFDDEPPWDDEPESDQYGPPASSAGSSASGAGQVAAAPPVASAAAAESVAAQPVVARPVAADPPTAAQSVAAQPVSAQPVSARPAVVQPVAAQPVSAQPVSAQPVAAQAGTIPAAVGQPAAPERAASAARRVEPAGLLPDAPEEPGEAAVAAAIPGQLDVTAVREVWPEIITAIGRQSKKISALASGATVRDFDGQTVVLTFRFPAHARMVAPEATLISNALYEALGGRWNIRCDVAGEGDAAELAAPSSGRLGRAAPGAGGRESAAGPAGGRESATGAAGGRESVAEPAGGGRESVVSSAGGGHEAAAGAPAGGSAAGSAVGDRESVAGLVAGGHESAAASVAVGRESAAGPAGGRQPARSDAARNEPPRGAGPRPPTAEVGAAQAQATRSAARAPQNRRPEAEAPASAGGDDDWPEPARPGGSAAAASPIEAVDDDEDWPEVRAVGSGSAATSAGLAESGNGGAASGNGDLGNGADFNSGHGIGGHGNGDAGNGGAAGGGASEGGFAADPAGEVGDPSFVGDRGPASSAGAGPSLPPAGALAGSGVDGARLDGTHDSPFNSGNSSPAGPSTIDPPGTATGNAGAPVDNGGRSGAPAPGDTAAPGQPSAPEAPGGGASRTGRNAGPGSGLAAARAAAAGGRGPNSRQGAKPGWPDGSPAEEAPYDPEYDGPPGGTASGGGSAGAAPAGASANFEGFDPGDEPLDEVIDEKTARESSEQQAMRLLRDAFGAEKIGES